MSVNKVTKLVIKYPVGFEPDIVIPKEYTDHRFVLGKLGINPLLAVCMNPSAAREISSDRTVNRIIKASQLLGYDGWIVVNLYAERATDVKDLQKFNNELHQQNLEQIKLLITSYGIKDAWGAWGDLKHINLARSHPDILKLLQDNDVELFHFSNPTKSGNPRHPLYLKVTPEMKRPFKNKD